jgi:2-isopropylmalate synthase
MTETPLEGDRLIVFDTTLRDGEQAPGCSMTLAEKLQVARALERLGVDVIEAGFPAASPGDAEAVAAIARALRSPVVAALARCREPDIDVAATSLASAQRPRLHVFLATSPIHRVHKLRMEKDAVLDAIRRGVAHARSIYPDVEFSAEDAARTEPEFLAEAVSAAIEAGATTINIPDTVGHAEPGEFFDRIASLVEVASRHEGVVISAHCHDDLGLALANSLAAVRAGARQVECTVNGLGERAGNCALEELVMAVRHRADRYGVHTGVRTEHLCATSRLVSGVTGVTVPPNKAVVGANAFAHEAGIHQHGVLADASTYEILRPDEVGAGRSALVLGKHSGRHAVRARLIELGHFLDESALETVFAGFKELADRKKQVDDDDLEALAVGTARASGPWQLVEMSATAGSGSTSHAAVRIRGDGGDVVAEAAVGDGPIDAAFRAISRAVGMPGIEFRALDIRSLTVGEDAQGRVVVTCGHGERVVRGHGCSTNVVEAAAFAIVDAVNRIENSSGRAQAAANQEIEAVR